MNPGFQLLAVPRLTRIIQSLQDKRDIAADNLFLGRTKVIPTDPSEILIRMKGNIFVADVIEDDAKATIVGGQQYSMETNKVPKIKQGRAITESLLKQLYALQGNGQAATSGMVNEFITQELDYIRIGIQQRQELMLVAMALDGLSYNKFGVNIQISGWGMPTEFKLNAATAWSDTLNATPITDLEVFFEIAQTKYNKTFNRLTMSYPAFRALIATTEFANRAKRFLNTTLSLANFSPRDTAFQMDMLKSILPNISVVEFYDKRVRFQRPDGTIVYDRIWPINEVGISNTSDDNDGTKMRFAEGITVEQMVGAMSNNGTIGSFGTPSYGIISYVTHPIDLNPPQFTMWGVESGFPRKDELECQAKINVGAITEVVTPGISFPLA